ncbi:MAG: ribonuclease D, partial [Verrucomicrobiales bacterium]|nr:ribonuclease D [Verrucomicrobiales bacterium]
MHIEHSLPSDPVPDKSGVISIDTSDALVRFLDDVVSEEAAKSCAIDTEADSLHSFREKLCLIQFESAGRIALIDPLANIDLEPLAEYLRGAEVWVHGGDFDMLMLKRAFGEVPEKYFDTQIAARLLGYERFGLAAMIEDVFSVALSKSSQRADWGKRPLSDKMLDYAANDVRYVRSLASDLTGRLDEHGRGDWFTESC